MLYSEDDVLGRSHKDAGESVELSVSRLRAFIEHGSCLALPDRVHSRYEEIIRSQVISAQQRLEHERRKLEDSKREHVLKDSCYFCSPQPEDGRVYVHVQPTRHIDRPVSLFLKGGYAYRTNNQMFSKPRAVAILSSIVRHPALCQLWVR